MLAKNKGCLCENLAVCWLQEQGYYVFKGSQTHCAIDLIAVDPKTLEHKFFDVKHIARRKDGSLIVFLLDIDQKNNGELLLIGS